MTTFSQSTTGSLSRKIGLIISLIATMVMGLVWIVHEDGDQAVSSTRTFIDADLPLSQHLARLKRDVLAQEPILYDYYATTRQEAFHDRREANMTSLEASLSLLKKGLSDRPEFINVKSQLKQYDLIAKELDSVLSANQIDWDRAREILARGRIVSEGINRDLDNLLEHIEKRMEQRGIETQTQIEGITKLVMMFSAALLVVALAMSYGANAYIAGAAERRKLEMFPERSPNPILSVNADGQILYANPGTAALLRSCGADPNAAQLLLPPDFAARAAAVSSGSHAQGFPDYEALGRVLGCGLHEVAEFGIYHLFISDFTERKQAEQRFLHQALHDSLTGLPNRRSFEQALAAELGAGTPGAVMLVNLDRFRGIIDSLGHAAGDRVLVSVADRLRRAMEEITLPPGGSGAGNPQVFRFESDLFAILAPNVNTLEAALDHARHFTERITHALSLDGRELYLSVSTGVALYPTDGMDPGTLTRNADTVVHWLKRNGGGTAAGYTADMNTRAVERLELDHALRQALPRNELELFFQPQSRLSDGAIIGAETLLRWRHPERGMISPMVFIPIAEESGLIVPIGEWVLEGACRQARKWLDDGLPPLVVAVNVSARQFVAGDLPHLVKRTLELTGLPASSLELEITESVAMNDVEGTVRTLEQLAALGIGLSIDDFGTGYSSLAYLKRFPIHKLKIDQSFVRHMTETDNDAAIVLAVVNLGHALGLGTIAEGVETDVHADRLRALGCDEMQGYLLSRPMPAAECTRFLEEAHKLALNILSKNDPTSTTI